MKRLLVILFMFCMILSSISIYAETDFRTLINNSGTLKDYPGGHVLTIFDSTLSDMQPSGLTYTNIHQLFKVLSEKGALNMSLMKFSYEPASAWMEIKKVKIYRNNGSIEVISDDQIYDYPAPGSLILWGAREQMVKIGRLEIGEAVEIQIYKKGYTYALLQDDDEKFIPPMKGHFYDIVPFWSFDYVLSKVYEVLIPEEKTVQYKVFNGILTENKSVVGNKILYSFCLKNGKPFPRENNMVDPWDIAPKLILTTALDWESKSRWFYKVNEDYGSFQTTPEITAMTNKILIGATDELDSVAHLTHWVADEIRYFGLTMGCGEGYTLHKGEMTFSDRCGVCKDKAGMLVTMLRAAGFEAYAAMTMAGSRIEDIPADHFNHSVTAVRLRDGKLHMLDPTWVPFTRELWSSKEIQQNYIVGTKNGEDLQEIPVSPPENHYYRISANTKVDSFGEISGTFELVAEGQSDASFRGIMTRMYRYEWDNLIRRSILDEIPEILIDSLYYSDPYDYSSPFQVFFSYRLYKGFETESLFLPVSARLLFRKMNPHLRIDLSNEKKKYSYRDNCSKLIEVKEVITFEKPLESILLPVSKQCEGSGADFKGGYTLDANQLVFNEKIVLKKRVYSPDDWSSYRQAIINQRFYSENFIRFNISTSKK